MDKIKINNIEFDMYSYYQTEIGLNVTIANTTFADIEEAVGSSAVVEIGEDYKGYNLTLHACVKDNGMIDVAFIDQDLVDVISEMGIAINDLTGATVQNTDDIEANAEAIVELAELIGGAE